MNLNKMEANSDRPDRLEQTVDHKKYLLLFVRRWWVLLLITLMGAVIGVVSYQIYRTIQMPVEYQAVSKYYITFGYDESGEVYQYYNGYTWNDILDTDPVMDKVLTQTKEIERGDIAAATTGEILSDIRVLTTTVSTADSVKTENIQKALEQALVEFGQEQSEIEEIKVIESGQTQRVIWDDKSVNALALGAILAFLAAVIGMLYFLALDDRIYVPSDLSQIKDLTFLGIGKEAEDNIDMLKLNDFTVLDVSNVFQEELSILRDENQGLILRVSWGKTTQRLVEKCVHCAELRNIKVYGLMIKDENSGFLKQYY